MLVGILSLGVGAAFLRCADLGSDPFNTMIFALSDRFSVSFTLAFVVVSALLFAVVLVVKRSLLGVASAIIVFGLGPVVELTLALLPKRPDSLVIQVLFLAVGVAVISLGCAFCLAADWGVAPYDALAPILDQCLPLSFRLCRILTDCLCVAVGMLFGAVPGLGTVVVALGLGPIIDFFLRSVARPLLAVPPKAAPSR